MKRLFYIEQQSEMHKICLLIWDVNTKFLALHATLFLIYLLIIHQ